MSRRPRTDSASITFNVNVPPEVIKEYFDGLAKVENAKHTPASPSMLSGFDWTSLAPILFPLLIQYLSSSGNSSSTSSLSEKYRSPVRVPESRSDVRSRVSESKDNDKPEIVISFVQKPAESSSESNKNEQKDASGKDSDEKKTNESETIDMTKVAAIVSTVVDALGDKKVEFDSTDKKSPSSEGDSSENVQSEKKKEESSEKKESQSEKKAKRPAYQEGDNVMQFDLNNLGGAGGIADMMKMFGPMFQGLSAGLENFSKPQEVSKSESKVEKKVEVLSAMVGDNTKESSEENVNKCSDELDAESEVSE